PSSAAAAATATAAATAAAASAGAASGKKTANDAASAKTSAGTRARARTAATAEPSGLDPERLRLIGLIAVLVLLVGGFGAYYWIALTGPGAGAGLPPVPMPTQGAAGTGGAGQIIVANSGAGSTGAGPDAANGDNAGNPADADDPLLGPTPASRSSQQDLERRLERTEQELAAAQQAIQAAAAPRAEQMPVLAAPKNDDIRVTRIVQPAPVAPALDRAYQAFNSGDTAGAQQQYDAALAQDANNRDALLGAAHVAARQNQKDKAAGYYLRLLELSPNDADATAGLIGLRQGDISQSEARLKAILATTPDAGPILFALGNLYAQQGRWPDAQQAYFRAVGAAPDNPDYAYNLAIGLDRLNQGKLALGYYQRALAMAQDKAVGFDRNALRKRMHELSTVPH
ncbi:tetratricopeptide repeat protein, partial [Duganella sp. FT134W]